MDQRGPKDKRGQSLRDNLKRRKQQKKVLGEGAQSGMRMRMRGLKLDRESMHDTAASGPENTEDDR